MSSDQVAAQKLTRQKLICEFVEPIQYHLMLQFSLKKFYSINFLVPLTGKWKLEMNFETNHHFNKKCYYSGVASQVEQSALTGFSTQYIAIVSVLGAVGLAVVILVVVTVTVNNIACTASS